MPIPTWAACNVVDDSQYLLGMWQEQNEITYLEHTDVIRAISDRKRHSTSTFLHKLHNQRLLQRWYTTTDDSLTQHCEFEEERFAMIVWKSLGVMIFDQWIKDAYMRAKKYNKYTKLNVYLLKYVLLDIASTYLV